MKNNFNKALIAVALLSTGTVYGQRNSYDDRRFYQDRQQDNRPQRSFERDLQNAYQDGYQDGKRETERFYQDRIQQLNRRNEELRDRYQERNNDQGRDNYDAKDDKRRLKNDYKNFTFGIYAGANSTRFEGEDINGNNLRGRLGYQFGAFVRGGGRLYGQLGAEYLTSSSDFYQSGDGTTVEDITSQIDMRYLHVPAYIGFKLAESKRGVSAIRLQIGAEFATPVGNNSNKDFGFERNDFQNATLAGLANLGFDAGPLFLDLVYQHGFADVLKNQSNTKRRILGVNVGLKF